MEQIVMYNKEGEFSNGELNELTFFNQEKIEMKPKWYFVFLDCCVYFQLNYDNVFNEKAWWGF